MTAARKYLLDTNLFIDGWRQAQRQQELNRFHRMFAPFEYLSAVVAHELCAGALGPDRREIERSVLEPFRSAGRVVAPSREVWEKAGDVLARLAREQGIRVSLVSRALGNDVLIALSCREAGVTLVTRNSRDFARIARIARFRWIEPWPSPAIG